MKHRGLVLLGLAFVLPALAVPAFADSTNAPAAGSSAPGVVVVPTVTVYGRPNKPNVVVVFKRPTAAAEAGAAHAAWRAAQLQAAEPASLKAQ
jgi:hypothetical protein